MRPYHLQEVLFSYFAKVIKTIKITNSIKLNKNSRFVCIQREFQILWKVLEEKFGLNTEAVPKGLEKYISSSLTIGIAQESTSGCSDQRGWSGGTCSMHERYNLNRIIAEIFERTIPPVAFTIKREKNRGNYKWCWQLWKCGLKYKSVRKKTSLNCRASQLNEDIFLCERILCIR